MPLPDPASLRMSSNGARTAPLKEKPNCCGSMMCPFPQYSAQEIHCSRSCYAFASSVLVSTSWPGQHRLQESEVGMANQAGSAMASTTEQYPSMDSGRVASTGTYKRRPGQHEVAACSCDT